MALGTNQCRYCPTTCSREQDAKRHEYAHFVEYLEMKYGDALWACVGVPADSPEAQVLPRDANEFTYGGRQMRGGCGTRFARKDCFKDHMKSCPHAAGDIDSPVLFGNSIAELKKSRRRSRDLR